MARTPEEGAPISKSMKISDRPQVPPTPPSEPKKELVQLSKASAPGQMEIDEMQARSASHNRDSSSRKGAAILTVALGLIGAGALVVGMPLLGAGLLLGGIVIAPSAKPFD